MRSNTALKLEHTHTARKSAQVINFRQVATESERASNLAGNAQAPDFEEFMDRYNLRATFDLE